MAKSFQLRVVTATGTVLDTRVLYCSLQTPEGSLGVLADHAPMLCALREGKLRFQIEDESEGILTHSSGVASVRDNVLTLLVDDAKVTINPQKEDGAPSR